MKKISDFFEAIKNLLPRGRTFDITRKKRLREFFHALAVLPEKVRNEAEKVYLDLFPESTRSPERWEKAFLVIFTKTELLQRRAVLASLWEMNNRGQSLFYLEKILQNIFPKIRIFENYPVINPRQSNVVHTSCVCGFTKSYCGGREAVCGMRTGDENFIPTILRNDTADRYSIPNNPKFWEFCFFIGESYYWDRDNMIIYIDKLKIPEVYRNYIEYFILRLKPVHTVAVLDIMWT